MPSPVVGVKSAARLHDRGDYWPGIIEVITQVPLRASREDVKLTRQRLDLADVISVNGFPVLPGNAVICEAVREGGDLSVLSVALMDGLQSGQAQLPTLATALETVAAARRVSSGTSLVVSLTQGALRPLAEKDWYLASLSETRSAV